MRLQLHAIAAGVGLTYELLTGDLSQVNYSSIRAGLIEFRRRMEALQWQLLVPGLCQPVWRRFVLAAQAAGKLPDGAIGADWTATLSSLVTCAVGFGFFYLLFPGGAHFGMTVANFLAIYACTFQFFRDANFPAASRDYALGAVAMPVLGFLGACIVRRRQVYSIIHARRIRELQHLPRITGWLLGALGVGAASFALPRLELGVQEQGLALLAAMALITLVVVASVRDVILVMIDIAMMFEGVAARLDRLVRPMMAFVTFIAHTVACIP